MFKGDVVKTCQYILLHRFKGPRTASSPELKLCCAPVLLNEIELTMIFWIEVAQVTTRFDVLLKQWFLRHEVSLSEEKMATAATGLSLRTLVASTFNRESRLGPKATLTDYLFHSLKPPWIMGVVIWEIKGLRFLGQGINPHRACVAHPDGVSRSALDLGGASSASIQQNRIKRLTFDHLSGGDGIGSTLQMTGCIIEHKESFGQAICLGLKNVDCMIDLIDELLRIKIAIAILPRLEHNACLSA